MPSDDVAAAQGAAANGGEGAAEPARTFEEGRVAARGVGEKARRPRRDLEGLMQFGC